MRQRCESEPELLRQGSGFVLYALMDAVVDRYFPIIDTLESELEAIEARIFSKERGVARANIEALYELKAKVTVLKHAVAPLFDAAGRLHGGRTPSVCANTQEYFRDVSDHLARVNASIDTMRDTISTAMAVNLSMVTIEENEVTKRLAAWAGIFAVITAFAGIWGMNFEFMPELTIAVGLSRRDRADRDLERHHVLAVPQVRLVVTGPPKGLISRRAPVPRDCALQSPWTDAPALAAVAPPTTCTRGA